MQRPSAHAATISAITRGYGKSRAEAVIALRELGADALAEVITAHLTSLDPNDRADGITLIAFVSPETVAVRFPPLFSGPHEVVRWHLCGMVYDFQFNLFHDHIVRLALHDPAPDVRFVAVSALGRIGSEDTIPILTSIHENDVGADREGRRIADEALEAIGQIKRAQWHG